MCTVRVRWGGWEGVDALAWTATVSVCVWLWGKVWGNGLRLCEQQLLGTSSYDSILSHGGGGGWGGCVHAARFIVEKYHCCRVTVNTWLHSNRRVQASLCKYRWDAGDSVGLQDIYCSLKIVVMSCCGYDQGRNVLLLHLPGSEKENKIIYFITWLFLNFRVELLSKESSISDNQRNRDKTLDRDFYAYSAFCLFDIIALTQNKT